MGRRCRLEGLIFLFSGHFRSFPVIGVNREGLRCVEERATSAAAPFRLLSAVDMDSMLEKGHRAWQGATVMKKDYAMAMAWHSGWVLNRIPSVVSHPRGCIQERRGENALQRRVY